MSKLTEQLKWRYAVKKMNGTKVSREKINAILEAINLAPTAYGLQPFKIFIIENSEIRENIFAESCPQSQIKDSSLILVFAATKKITQDHVNTYLRNMEVTRGAITRELRAYLTNSYKRFVEASEEENFNWSARQSYIALGYAIIAAASEEVDTTPMEGFNPTALDKILNLKEKNLGSVAILALGYRDKENDWLAKLPKVRKRQDELFVELN